MKEISKKKSVHVKSDEKLHEKIEEITNAGGKVINVIKESDQFLIMYEEDNRLFS